MDNEVAGKFFQDLGSKAGEVNGMVDQASSTGNNRVDINVSGQYLVTARSFVMAPKDKPVKPIPNLSISDSGKSKGALTLNLNLEVVDGTEAVPKGASIWHTIYLVQGPDADKEKQRKTVEFMKPQICALTGLNDFKLDEKFVAEYLSVDYDPATKKITRQHKMNQKVMIVVEPYINPNTGQTKFTVKSLRRATATDKSVSVKTDASAEASLDSVSKEINENRGTAVKNEALNYDPSADEAQASFVIEDA